MVIIKIFLKHILNFFSTFYTLFDKKDNIFWAIPSGATTHKGIKRIRIIQETATIKGRKVGDREFRIYILISEGELLLESDNTY